MTHLSVNLNKVSLVRNSRGMGVPDIVAAARMVIGQGCQGLTLHPREDERHATLDDVRRLAALPEVASGAVELNIEGDPRPELMRVVREIRATQFTVVPVVPGEITTNHGWHDPAHLGLLRETVIFFNGEDDGDGVKTRISCFVDTGPAGVELAAEAGAHAVELHTYDYARAFGTEHQDEVLARYEQTAQLARQSGLRVHAGHDLDLENLPLLLARLQPDEVSIGHALISRALMAGLPGVLREYVGVVGAGG